MRRRGEEPCEGPLVLVEAVRGAQRLAAVSREALRLGLAPGLPLADARARVPNLLVREHEPSADSALLARMAEDAQRWTPLVALDPPHGLMLDVTGCAHLFDGEAAMRERVLQRLRRGGFSARGSLAGTPEAARALARFGRAAVVPTGHEAEAVRPLSIAALELPEETALALRRAGFKRIGDLADRPSAPLTSRFGPELSTKLRRLLGREDVRITPERPLPTCSAERAFAEPISRSETIARVLRALIEQVCAQLEGRGEGGRAFEARFDRTDGAKRRIGAEAGRPLRDPEAIDRLFRERLDALADPLDPGFGFDSIVLSVLASEPLDSVQPTLDGRAVAENEVADLIDRLIARFGPARVARFVPVDTHDPVRAARLVPATVESREGEAWPRPEPGEPPTRPLHLLEPPEPVEAVAEVPDGPPIRFRWRRALHDVARAEGPERILPEWWRDRQTPARDYYRVEDARGRRFWLFREGQYEEGESPRWYLHGLFA
ncbi:MAG TPA: DNA polymerase Y family protein [Beijerinckiaceae bacterium]